MNIPEDQLQSLKEIEGWKLSPEESAQVYEFSKSIYEARKQFNATIIENRAFCVICALKIFVENTFSADKTLAFLSNIQKLELGNEDKVYLIKEFYFLTFMIGQLNHLGLDFLQKHFLEYIKLHHTELLKNEEAYKSIAELKVLFLAINAMLSEILSRIMDAYDLIEFSDKDKKRKVFEFIFVQISDRLNNVRILHFEIDNTILIQIRKFAEDGFPEYSLFDPIIINRNF